MGLDNGAGDFADPGAGHAGVFLAIFRNVGAEEKAQSSQHLGRTRAGEGQACPLLANVCQLHIVHYNKVVKMAHQARDLVNTRIEQQVAGTAVDVAVALNPSLNAEQKAVISLSSGSDCTAFDTMPLSQRRRSLPVTRIFPRQPRSLTPAEWRRESNSPAGHQMLEA